jgi:hypothetical protein
VYLEDEKERAQTILSGVPISAENIRLTDQELGTQWHGTSWFFLMHAIAKTFTKVDKIPFSSILTIPQDYGIQNWIDSEYLRKQLKSLAEVFNKRGLGNVVCNKNGDLSIGGIITHKELNKFADLQYQYSMGQGLVRFSPYLSTWLPRRLSNYAERIWWHYTTAVYKSPKIYNSQDGENYLKALLTDFSERTKQRPSRIHDLEIWEPSHLEHSRPLLRGWERELISKEVLKTFDIGEITFITPRYFAEADLTINSIKEVESLNNLLTCLESFPAYPVSLGNEKAILLSQELERAGLVIKVTEPGKYSVPRYSYLVSPKVFHGMETKIKYSYSNGPAKEYGDVSITDRIFRTLGRARLYSEKLLPELKSSKRDYKQEIESIIQSLEQNGEAELSDLEGVFKPLTTLNILQINDRRGILNKDFGFVVKLLAESYYNLVNEPELVNLTYPTKKEAESSEFSQVKKQIELGIAKMFE